MIYAFFLFVFVQKSFRFAEINLTIRGPFYTCLVLKHKEEDEDRDLFSRIDPTLASVVKWVVIKGGIEFPEMFLVKIQRL